MQVPVFAYRGGQCWTGCFEILFFGLRGPLGSLQWIDTDLGDNYLRFGMRGEIADPYPPFCGRIQIALTEFCPSLLDNPLTTFTFFYHRLILAITIIYCSVFLHTILRILQTS